MNQALTIWLWSNLRNRIGREIGNKLQGRFLEHKSFLVHDPNQSILSLSLSHARTHAHTQTHTPDQTSNLANVKIKQKIRDVKS